MIYELFVPSMHSLVFIYVITETIIRRSCRITVSPKVSDLVGLEFLKPRFDSAQDLAFCLPIYFQTTKL